MIYLNKRKIKILVLLSLIFFISCISKDSGLLKFEDGSRDLAEILTEGRLVAATDYNSTNYFIYKGEPMGYQFEMLYALAAHLGVELELVAENNLDKSFALLKKGDIDLIASNLTITAKRKKHINFTEPYAQTRQVLVQRKINVEDYQAGKKLIRNQLDLEKKVVYVQKNSSYADRLRNLSDEIGGTINIVEMDKYEAEQLVELVANNEIEYTVCDENVAKVMATLHPNLDVETAVGFPQKIAWAVREESPDLENKINEWLRNFTNTAEYRILKSKYFENPTLAKMMKSDYFYVHSGNISQYDDQIKAISTQLNWDWRLLASLIYQESRFKHDQESRSGAYGIMQFMPATAEQFGIEHKTNPSTQLETGVKYLLWLDERMKDNKIPDEERVKFILAAYNAGIGHVLDARNLAKKFGKDPNVWENNVDFFIKNKSEFSTDSTVRFGSLRGKETYHYVSDILKRYEHYKNLVKE